MGYAILFDATETFDSMMTGDQLLNPTNGLGILSDAISCYVEEERNSFFELEMEYPAKGIHAEKLQLERLIVAKPNALSETWQAFRIYRMTQTLDGIINVYARHISYAFSGFIFTNQPYLCEWYSYVFEHNSAPSSWHDFPQPFLTDKQAGYKVANLALLINDSVSDFYGGKFSVQVDSTMSSLTRNVRLNGGEETIDTIRSFMQGRENSIVDIFGGVWEWDNFKAILRNSRESNNSGKVTARVGSNITELEYDASSEDIYSSYVPYVIYDEKVAFYVPPITVDNVPSWLERSLAIDCSDLFDDEELKDVDFTNPLVVARFRAKVALRIISGKLKPNLGKVASKTTFQYEALDGYDVGIDDVINVIYEPMNLQYSTKVVRVKYDVIRERTEEIETGTHTQTFKWSELLKK